MSRRVYLSSDGLRVSSAGFDAKTAADDGHAITFDSSWTDIAKLHTIGLASWAANSIIVPPSGTTAVSGFTATWPDLGYKPFVELRRLSGNVILDDFFDSTLPAGNYSIVESSRALLVSPTSTSDHMLFIVYQIPVPSG
jgi:hypothetical protein